MTKLERMKEIAKASPNFGKRVGYKMCVVDELHDMKELEEKISVLLSCKNCPENKGGYICQKEYEDKCLAQKIQYIKELKEENTELKSDFIKSCKVKEQGFKEAEQALERKDKQLTKAKEIIKTFLGFAETFGYSPSMDKFITEAEQFLKESE